MRRVLRFTSLCSVLLCSLLAMSCSQQQAEDLVQRLKTRDVEELEEITAKLVRLPNGIAVPALRQGLRSDAWRTRYMSARFLGRFGATEAEADLLIALEDSVGGVRAQAAGALGRLSSRAATGQLVQLLEDESEIVRTAAAGALAAIGDAQALPALLQLSRVQSLTLRVAVIEALGSCAADSSGAASADSATDSLRRQAMRVVHLALDHELPRLRIAGIVSLRGASYVQAVGDLLRLVDDPSDEVQHVAVQALGEITSTRHPAWQGHAAPDMAMITGTLEQAAASASNPAVRQQANRALARIAEAQVAEAQDTGAQAASLSQAAAPR